MSRTVAHVPWWTRPDIARYLVETHDHRFGPCDLPSLTEWAASARRQSNWHAPLPWRCRWEVDRRRIPCLCGCALCTGRTWRRLERRQDRHRAKERNQTGAWAAEWGEIDGAD